MSGERKYIFVLATIAVFFIIFELASPEKTNWNITYHKNDKNPYGSYLIHERLPDLFEKVNHSYSTIYELADTVQGDLFVLSQQFNPSKEDVKALLKYISKGNNALIASSFFDKEGFLDTLDLSTDYFLIDNIIMEGKEFTDSVDVSFTKPNKLDPAKFSFDSDAINTYFQSSNNFEILASLDELPVFIEKDHGVGKLYLCTIPIAFTNNYLLHEQTDILISQMFSHLPYGDFTWTEYYQIGRLEARTPLRYILSEEALKMAYYLILISLGFFIFFEIKRKQRIIPVIPPLSNTTLEFVHTLGNLYYRSSNHKTIAEKRILFFVERLRINYYFKTMDWSENFMNEVAQKTGNGLAETRKLFEHISTVRNSKAITENQLIELNKRLDNFKITD